jgi:hypothetical protein
MVVAWYRDGVMRAPRAWRAGWERSLDDAVAAPCWRPYAHLRREAVCNDEVVEEREDLEGGLERYRRAHLLDARACVGQEPRGFAHRVGDVGAHRGEGLVGEERHP